jgi:signal recognition particle receptor subunit beta
MPHIDAKSGEIVIRIVYDGIPEAGKTTNVQQLFGSIPLQRRGTLASPAAQGRRTEFFDWLDFSGGFVDGRRIRCQLITVPGQPQLLRRRRYLLESADAVVFVADSQPASVEDNRGSLSALLSVLESIHPTLPAPIVIQANKQDLPDALRPRRLSEELGMPLVTPVVPAVAQAGRGVLDTFVLAARLASDRVRALMLGGVELGALEATDRSAEALHSAMMTLERDGTDEARPVRPSLGSLVRNRANDVKAAAACRLPRPEAILAGHVWPSVKGRAALATAVVGAVEIPEHTLDWAPPEPIEIVLAPGWILHSSARWSFATESEARPFLMSVVRKVAASPELVPEGRAFFLAPDDEGFRLWMLTPETAPLALALLDAIREQSPGSIASALGAIDRAAAILLSARGTSAVPGGAAGIAMRNGQVNLLSIGEQGDSPMGHALRLAARAVEGDAAAEAAVARARALLGGTDESDVSR